MCPICIASTAAMVAGAGSTGGILVVGIGKFRKVFKANRSVSEKGDIKCQPVRKETTNTGKDIAR